MKIKPADEVTEMLAKPIIEDLPFKSGDEVLLFVNSMGGTPLLELFVVYRKAHELLKDAGIKVTRSLVGPYITSLEMAGASVTVLKLDNQLTQLWDAPVVTPGLRWGA
jgi:phosphoenolpyruvate---glycerone phosphotransferase subunit DhaK